jgi:hypothetical protein
VLDPDAGVRHAVRLLFDTFTATGSAFGAVKAFRGQQLTFPARHHRGQLFFQPLGSPEPSGLRTSSKVHPEGLGVNGRQE